MYPDGIRRLADLMVKPLIDVCSIHLMHHLLRLVIDIKSSFVLAQEKEAPAHLLQVERVLRVETCGRLEQGQGLLYSALSSHDLACEHLEPLRTELHALNYARHIKFRPNSRGHTRL